MITLNPEQMEAVTGGALTDKSSRTRSVLQDAIRMKNQGYSRSKALSALKKEYWDEPAKYIESVIAKVYGN